MWSASPTEAVVSYQIRFCTGRTYRAKDESASGRVSADVLTFDTLSGLPVANTTATFKVYAVTDLGNEKGSAAVVVTRPGG